MAVRGLNRFISHLSDYKNEFVLIGGTACDVWFTEQNLKFRSTTDLDVVLILDQLSKPFIEAFWQMVTTGKYQIKNRSEGVSPILYRFEKPLDKHYPETIELFCPQDAGLENLAPNQYFTAVRLEDGRSLSAILLDDTCYQFLINNSRESSGIMFADTTALIPLKARAWLDLSEKRSRGQPVDSNDIKKHRGDVFRLAVLLPEDRTIELPGALRNDLVSFLERHPVDGPDWKSIRDSIRSTIGGQIRSETLISAIRRYFRMNQ